MAGSKRSSSPALPHLHFSVAPQQEMPLLSAFSTASRVRGTVTGQVIKMTIESSQEHLPQTNTAGQTCSCASPAKHPFQQQSAALGLPQQ